MYSCTPLITLIYEDDENDEDDDDDDMCLFASINV